VSAIERPMPPLNADERHNGHADLIRERIDGTTGV
jgi:Protein of unknown function (DUF664)